MGPPRWYLAPVLVVALVPGCSPTPDPPAGEGSSESPGSADGVRGDAARATPETESVDSFELEGSFLLRGEYRPESERLTLYFEDGSIYEYDGVPGDYVAELRADPDDFFNDSIRPEFAFRRLTPSVEPDPRPAPAPARPVCGSDGQAADRLARARRAVVSEVLDAVAYDAEGRCLELAFDSGHVYRYAGVPSEAYEALIRPDSVPGAYYNENIRNAYPSQLVSRYSR